MANPLYKSTIIIWSEYSGFDVELSVLARNAETGDAYCSQHEVELVSDPPSDPDFDGTEFFGANDEFDGTEAFGANDEE